MELSKYLDQGRRGTALARALGVPQPTVSQWKSGDREVPIHRCTDIELATDRQVMRWDLRPDDWWRIWPELIGLEGAPAVPDKEAA